MVARNPLFHGRWTAKKFQATVINDIWPEMIFFSLVATMVVCVSKFTEKKLVIDTGLLTVLGTVLGLTISFRTSSAYERYQDGRKMWTSITIASRNMAQMFWLHIPVERANGPTAVECIVEKKTMINLVQAFSVACKHFLRGEAGVYYEDLYPLISVLPRYSSADPQAHTIENMLPLWQASEDHDYPYDPSFQPATSINNINPSAGTNIHRTTSLPDGHVRDRTLVTDADQLEKGMTTGTSTPGAWFRSDRKKKFDPEEALPHIPSHRPLRPAREPPEATLGDYFPFVRFFRWIGRGLLHRAKPVDEIKRAQRRQRKIDDLCQSNVPLEIVLFLSSYTAWLMKKGLLMPAIATATTNNLQILQDTMSQLERIGNTPLPFAYQAHLRLSLWLYLFFLPFQIYAKFDYLTIPGTAFATFLLVGFLEIGQEIENPFNYDLNDLDLDGFCLSIQRELHEITAHISPEPDQFVFSHWNQPFAPADRRTADEIVKAGENYANPAFMGVKPGIASVRATLVRSWREVDRLTRDTHKM